MNLHIMREKLIAEKQEILGLIGSMPREGKPPALDRQSMGRLSWMDVIQQEAMSAEAQRRRKMRLRGIEAALKRIEEGDYGYCTICGDEIVERRLEFDPTTPFCMSCAQKRQ